MTIMDTMRDALRGTGNVLAQALSLNGKPAEVFSSGGLTFADDADAIMVAGSPGRPTCVFPVGPLSSASLPA